MIKMKNKEELIKKIVTSCYGQHDSDEPLVFIVPLRPTLSESSPFPHLVGFSHLTACEYYSEKLSLTSTDGSYLLRIIKDAVNQHLIAHLLHQEKAGYQYVFICPDNHPECYLTDSHGLAVLKEIDPCHPEIKLMPPVAIFEFCPLEAGRIEDIRPAWFLETFKNSSLQVEIFPQDRTYIIKVYFSCSSSELKAKKMVLIKKEEEPLIAIPLKNITFFEVPARFIDSEKVQINIYG